MDVIALHRLGFPVAVATCGTSLTEQHIKIIKRYTDNVYFLFDSDLAGQNATLRALGMTYQHDIFPKKIMLPEGYKDADDLANLPNGKEVWEQCFKQAKD
jgi:DNA primase